MPSQSLLTLTSEAAAAALQQAVWGTRRKNVKRVQFFVNRGKGFTTVVRCSPDAVLSDVLHLDTDEYAVCGSRFVKVGGTLSENWIGKGSNVEVLPAPFSQVGVEVFGCC